MRHHRAYDDFFADLRRGALRGPGGAQLKEWAPAHRKTSFFACLANAAWGKPGAHQKMRELLLRRFLEILLGEPVSGTDYRQLLDDLNWESLRQRPLASRAVRSLAESCGASAELGDAIQDTQAFKRACTCFVLANGTPESPVFQAIPLLYVFARIFGLPVYLYDLCSVWDSQNRVTRERVGVRPRCDPIHANTFTSELSREHAGVCLLRVRPATLKDQAASEQDRYVLLLRQPAQPTRPRPQPHIPYHIMWYGVQGSEGAESADDGHGYLIRMSPAISRPLELIERRVFGLALPTGSDALASDTVFSLSCDPIARTGPFGAWVFVLLETDGGEERVEFVCQGSAACFTIAFSLNKWQQQRPKALFVTAADSLDRAQEQVWVELNKALF